MTETELNRLSEFQNDVSKFILNAWFASNNAHNFAET
jgi:hypothetical protein